MKIILSKYIDILFFVHFHRSRNNNRPILLKKLATFHSFQAQTKKTTGPPDPPYCRPRRHPKLPTYFLSLLFSYPLPLPYFLSWLLSFIQTRSLCIWSKDFPRLKEKKKLFKFVGKPCLVFSDSKILNPFRHVIFFLFLFHFLLFLIFWPQDYGSSNATSNIYKLNPPLPSQMQKNGPIRRCGDE